MGMRTKYVKIERNGFTNAYTTLKVAKHALSIGVIQSYAPVTLKQIKAEGLHHCHEADYFRHIAKERFLTVSLAKPQGNQ